MFLLMPFGLEENLAKVGRKNDLCLGEETRLYSFMDQNGWNGGKWDLIKADLESFPAPNMLEEDKLRWCQHRTKLSIKED